MSAMPARQAACRSPVQWIRRIFLERCAFDNAEFHQRLTPTSVTPIAPIASATLWPCETSTSPAALGNDLLRLGSLRHHVRPPGSKAIRKGGPLLWGGSPPRRSAHAK